MSGGVARCCSRCCLGAAFTPVSVQVREAGGRCVRPRGDVRDGPDDKRGQSSTAWTACCLPSCQPRCCMDCQPAGSRRHRRSPAAKRARIGASTSQGRRGTSPLKCVGPCAKVLHSSRPHRHDSQHRACVRSLYRPRHPSTRRACAPGGPSQSLADDWLPANHAS